MTSRNVDTSKCPSKNPDATDAAMLGCELEQDHYGIHMVSTTDGGAVTWFRNYDHVDVTKDTFRIPISERNAQPERRATMDELLDAQGATR